MLSFSPRIRRLVAVLALLAVAHTAGALSVIAPTFEQLVSTSDLIARGVITDVRCVTVDTAQGQKIKTLVTLRVERALKGSPAADVTLSFLGGQIGRRRITVVGMPTFQKGARQLVFVNGNGRVLCPLTAAGHGRYHVQRDAVTGRDHVYRDNGQALASVDEVVRPLESHASAAASAMSQPLSLEQFEAQITQAVNRTGNLVQP